MVLKEAHVEPVQDEVVYVEEDVVIAQKTKRFFWRFDTNIKKTAAACAAIMTIAGFLTWFNGCWETKIERDKNIKTVPQLETRIKILEGAVDSLRRGEHWRGRRNDNNTRRYDSLFEIIFPRGNVFDRQRLERMMEVEDGRGR